MKKETTKELLEDVADKFKKFDKVKKSQYLSFLKHHLVPLTLTCFEFNLVDIPPNYWSCHPHVASNKKSKKPNW